MKIIEYNHNIMIGYKKSWNHHLSGESCWCKPSLAKINEELSFLFHRNYEWRDGEWWRIHESGLREKAY